MRIRNPRIRHGFSKADSYEKRDPDTNEDLIRPFIEVDRKHVQNIVAQYRGCKVTELDDDFLVNRLAEANTRRRRRFAYWSQHRLNLSRRSEAMKQRAEEHPTGPSQLTRPQIAPTTVLTQATTATYLDITKVDVDDGKSVISTSSIWMSEENTIAREDAIDVPALPKSLQDREDLKEFECPYCFTICSRRFLRCTAWR